MAVRPNHLYGKKPPQHGWLSALRYWLFWAALIGAMAYGTHRYFEYRNAELDKRLERLK